MTINDLKELYPQADFYFLRNGQDVIQINFCADVESYEYFQVIINSDRGIYKLEKLYVNLSSHEKSIREAATSADALVKMST